ncbi:type II secretion system GspH family protein [Shewanella schlegeliana]|uniref:Type II secretion system protein n=1 Tax=Shewanella schlegeliana TaxID=190308 RepID=A0ABS1SWS9_9GAMM|nr:type II secretion system protein [Shewanella schlegeliana]MBL4913008.1 type II secretion system protein [Shewanella schlegeliana]MCL1108896.1 type II secretion system GspH family protein [Shewanella schlegeliana]GIU23787.1 MSHA biogenesis protein MshC [Shewanella schlegeliana]
MHRAQRHAGFTLVELVTTIILIAILAVVVIPRLLTSSSYSAFTLRDEFISELRKVQMMAMNNQDRCYRLSVTDSQYQVSRYQGACSGTPVRTDAPQAFQGGASLALLSSGASTFNIQFNAQGVPIVDGARCSGNCISVIADETLFLAIESEGYIHDGQ